MILQIENSRILADLTALNNILNPSNGDCYFVTSESCVYNYYANPRTQSIEGWVKDLDAVIYEKSENLSVGYTDVTIYFTLTNELRIKKYIGDNTNPLISDFSIVGLNKVSPTYHRGIKKSAVYQDPSNGKKVVEKIFSDVLDQSQEHIIGLEVQFNWYDETDNIGLTKTEIVKSLNKAEEKTLLRNRRERQIDFLLAGAESTPIEPIVNALINHYSNEVDLYITHGVDNWETAINNESNTTILGYLNIEVPRTDNPGILITIKNSMLYQITGDINLLN